MRAAALLLVLTPACILPLATGIPLQPDFDYRRLEGIWKRIARASRGSKPPFDASEINISPLRRGDLSVGMRVEVRLACRFVSFRFRHAGTPGKFHVYYPDGSSSTVHVVQTDYSSFLILHSETAGDTTLYLFARRKDAPDGVREDFREYVRALGFSENNIAPQELNVRCPLSN